MDFFRNKRNSVITIVVFGFIILTFIFWGFYHQDDFSQGRPISVNDEEISPQDFNRAFQNRMSQFSQFYGGRKISEGMEDLIRKQTAKSLVMRLAMAQEAEALGLLVGDQDIKQQIKEFAAFKNPATGNFSPEQYKTALENFGYTPARFERDIRNDVLVERLQSVLDLTLLTPKAELIERKQVQDFALTLESAVFTNTGLVKSGKIKLTEADLKTSFEKTQKEYSHSERRVLEIATMNKMAFSQSVEISEAEARAAFESQIKNSSDEQFKKERARAKHILISQKDAKGKSQIETIKREIEAKGKTTTLETAFGEIAKLKSEDFGSAAKSGDLGYFVKETMDPAFGEAVFNPKNLTGKIIGPVLSQFGYHLIYVSDRSGAENTFENRRKEAELLARQDKIRDEVKNLKERLTKELAGETTDAPKLLTELGFQTIKTTGLAKMHNDSRAPFNVVQKAFELKAKEWAAPEEFEDSIKVFRVAEILAPAPKTFAEARREVQEKLESERAESLVQEAFKQLQEGKLSWAKLTEHGVELKKETSYKPFLSREVPGFSDVETIAKAASSLSPKNPLSKPLFQEGRWIIFKGSNFKEPPAELTEAQLKEALDGVQTARRSSVFDAFVEDLIKRARIPKSQRVAYGLDEN
jgi:peptidyl-prolyl cis-trans isomerase D